MVLAVEMNRKVAEPQYVVAMALQTAYLCVIRSVEVRATTCDAITDQVASTGRKAKSRISQQS
jgi:hypothetical protein